MEREQLEQAITALEAQRAVLGDKVVEAAISSLREKIASEDQKSEESLADTGMMEAQYAPPLAGERRVVTILFCDIKGSTAMAEQLDPEVWAGIIRGAMEILIEPVRSHDGTVAQVMGDGILAFFGAPMAHENDPQRAVLAGLEILEDIQAYREQLKRTRGLEFNVRVGLHTGLVVVGEVGSEGQVEYTAIGDTVNLAARMEQTARPGTMQISEQTYKLVEGMFECQPLGEIHLRGKRLPVRTYRVMRMKGEPAPLRGLEKQGLYSALVGREAELAVLEDALDRLLDGQGGIVGILGEAGVGKSRLVAELYQDAPLGRLAWMEGHTLSYGQTIPYWPFQEILRCYADITNNDGEGQAWEKLRQKITLLFPENPGGTGPSVAEILPYLASLLNIPMQSDYLERLKYLDGEALGKQIFLASRRFFERLANVQPVVLVFEDLHWMDASSVSLLEHLLPLVENLPMLILGLSRLDRQAPAARLAEVITKEHGGRYAEIRLAPLSQDNSAQLMRNLIEIDDLPGRVRQSIMSKADGNPFFLEEILRALIDLGAIRRDASSGRWQATPQIEILTIPDTVQGVILARLDRLEESVKQVLRLASVIGRSFLYRVLRAIAEAGERLDDQLVMLQNSELIEEKQRLPELEYLFKHALAQEATYESILLQTRRELHARVGQAIEEIFPDRLEEFYSLLAHHYAKAEAWEKAQAYLIKAADQAGRMAADAEALAHYRQAMEAYALAFGDRWDPVERAALERKMGEAYLRRGEFNEALQYFYQALADLGHPAPKAGREMRMTFLREVILQVLHALLPGIFRTRQPGPGAEEELRVYQAIENSIGAGNPELFLLIAFRMLNFSEVNGLPAGVAMGSGGLGVLCYYMNFQRLSRRYLLRAVKLSEQLQRRDILGLTPVYQMQLEGIEGNWEAVSAYEQQAEETFRETGNLGVWWVSMSCAETLEIWRGDYTRALDYGNKLDQYSQDAADRLLQGDALGAWGGAELRLGKLDQAYQHLKQAVEITEASGNVYFRILTGIELGQCTLRMGDWQAALDTLEKTRQFMVKRNFSRDPYSNTLLRNNLAWAYLMAAEQSAPRERAAWLKKAKSACRKALKWTKSCRLGKPVALRMQGRYFWLVGDTSQAKRGWEQSLAEAEALRTPYELGLTHLEIGQRLGERDHLEQAEAIFTELGAELDLARARETLKPG